MSTILEYIVVVVQGLELGRMHCGLDECKIDRISHLRNWLT